MQRRTQMNLQLQQQWTHDGEATQTSTPAKAQIPRKPAKRRPPVTIHSRSRK
jgi:hypothetical protein